jgi:DNA invertase Pin-like site-specific DNA recombinase
MRALIYGYARVSTDAKDLTNQLAQLKAARCGTIVREKDQRRDRGAPRPT